MSKNIKEWVMAIMLLFGLLGFFLLYIYKAHEIESKIKLSSNLKQKFIKNFTTPNGIDFSLLLACKPNDIFEGDIILKKESQIIYHKVINNLILENYISSNSSKQFKYYILVPKGIIQQNTKYTIIINFQNTPIVNSIYLKFFQSDLGNFFHRFGLSWLRVKL